MLNKKTLLLMTTTLLLLNLVTADVTFDDPDDVKYYTGLEMWESDSENNKVLTLSHDGTDQGITLERGDITLNGGQIDLGSSKIVSLAKPSSSKDAVNREYVMNNFVKDDNDVLSGYLDMDGNDIKNLQDPDSAQDAANQRWVNDQINSIDGSQNISQVLEQGSKANQTLYLGNNRIRNLSAPSKTGDAVNLGYVNTNFFNRSSGGSIEGNIDMLNNNITNLADPDSDQDAANKRYVDSQVSSSVEANTDNQTLSVNNNVNNQDDNISIGNGNTVTIDDYYEANTNTQIDTENASSNVDMNNYKIVGLADPSSSKDAVNREYVMNNFVKDDNDVLSGYLDMDGNDIKNLQDPDSAQDAANQRWVNDQISSSVEANTDNQTLTVNNDVSGTSDNISIGNGNTVQIDDDFEANTNTQLDDQKAQSNVDMNGNNITSSGGEFCVGSEC